MQTQGINMLPDRQQAGDVESLNIKALQQRALELWEVDQTSALELGRALCAVREAMIEEHGAFAKWFRENGLEENRVYYCIRRFEGKSSPPTPAPTEVLLNKNNLLLANYAPPKNGKFVVSSVKVGPDGTTVTDGFVLMRVGLPEGSTCSESVAVPASFMSSIAGPAMLTCRRDLVSVETGDITQTTKSSNDFPPVEGIIAANPECQNEVPENGVAFKINSRNLFQVLHALNKMSEEEHGAEVQITVHPNMLRVDYRCISGQPFEGYIQCSPPKVGRK